jgi:hypothetical protein
MRFFLNEIFNQTIKIEWGKIVYKVGMTMKEIEWLISFKTACDLSEGYQHFLVAIQWFSKPISNLPILVILLLTTTPSCLFDIEKQSCSCLVKPIL